MRFNILLFILLFIHQPAWSGVREVEHFMNNTINSIVGIIESKDMTKEQKFQSLEKKLKLFLDLDWMCKFSLGKVWRTLDEEQKNNFLNYYKDYIVQYYVPRFFEYNNQVVNILGIKDLSNNQYIIYTETIDKLGSDSEQRYKIDYRCKEYDNNTIKIRDIITEGISLIAAQRNEFSSVVQREGVSYLITQLKQKVLP